MVKKSDNKEFAIKIFKKSKLLKSNNNDIVNFIFYYILLKI